MTEKSLATVVEEVEETPEEFEKRTANMGPVEKAKALIGSQDLMKAVESEAADKGWDIGLGEDFLENAPMLKLRVDTQFGRVLE